MTEPPPPSDDGDADVVIRVAIIDDHDAVRLGLRALLQDVDGIDIVAIGANVADATSIAAAYHPDVMMLDYRLPDGTGADAARAISASNPDCALVMVTAATERRVLGECLDAGCASFVSKNADRSDLIQAIRASHAHDSYFTRDVLKQLTQLRRGERNHDGVELAERELEVLQLTADGLSPEQIADVLFLSPHTVKNHLRHAMDKLGAHTKLMAVVKAIKMQLIAIDG